MFFHRFKHFVFVALDNGAEEVEIKWKLVGSAIAWKAIQLELQRKPLHLKGCIYKGFEWRYHIQIWQTIIVL